MINDLDETLRELLVRAVPIDIALVDITFAMPGKDWATAISRPAVNLFLYDIRENVDLRSNERYLARGGASGTEARAPARVDLTYLVSAWTSDVSDEHKLLGDVLRALLGHPVLPQEVLKGTMADQAYPLRAWIAQPDRTPHAWDFWGGLDGRMKPAHQLRGDCGDRNRRAGQSRPSDREHRQAQPRRLNRIGIRGETERRMKDKRTDGKEWQWPKSS